MIIKLYFEDESGSMGGWEYVSLLRLMWWIFTRKINPKENSATYYISGLETKCGIRI